MHVASVAVINGTAARNGHQIADAARIENILAERFVFDRAVLNCADHSFDAFGGEVVRGCSLD
jgi:hypothetical protein